VVTSRIGVRGVLDVVLCLMVEGMGKIVDIGKIKREIAIKKGFRNWESVFKERYTGDTRLRDLSIKTLIYLGKGKEDAPFYIYDLIMNLLGMGSGFQFYELKKDQKLFLMDCYLFLLDRIRFEIMRRLGWIESYPDQDQTIVDMITMFKGVETSIPLRLPQLSKEHPEYRRFIRMSDFEKEEFIRRMIPKALKKIVSYSTTL